MGKKILFTLLFFNLGFGLDLIDSNPIYEVDLENENGVLVHWKVYEGCSIKDDNIGNRALINETWISDDGDVLIKATIPGSPPPEEYDQSPAEISRNAVLLDEVPASTWVFGCVPTTGQMLAGYYDRHGYDNIYTGPTNNGLFPLDNSSWGTTVINGETRALGPLSASMMGLDGRTEKGHVDDYWYQYGSWVDPYHNNWEQHDWYADHACIADFMVTNIYIPYGLPDGATTIWYNYYGNQYTHDSFGDAGYGQAQFFENQGYEVDVYYNQATQFGSWVDNTNNGFTFLNFKDEIDNGRPVMIHLDGHTVLGLGYDDSTNPETVYLYNTWDHNLHSMSWNGYYEGMATGAVSCFSISNDSGCTDPNACNYSEEAINDDGSCDYSCHDNGDYSLSFDGMDDYVSSEPVNTDFNNGLAIKATIKTNYENDNGIDNNGHPNYIVSQYGSGQAAVEIGILNNKLFVHIRDNSNDDVFDTEYYYLHGDGLADNMWHTILVNYDTPNNFLQIQIDDNIVFSEFAPNNIGSISSDKPITLAYQRTHGQYFNGYISEVKIWDSIDYNDQNLIVNYFIDKGVDSFVYDHSGNQNHGIIHGAEWVDALEGWIVGDLNNDLEHNIIDVVIIIDIILGNYNGGEEPSYPVLWVSDLNSDDDINIQDIILLVEMVLEF